MSNLKWGIEKRLKFIDFRLFWEGEINRADIMSRFGVSVPQASKDLSLYQEQAPDNIVYNKSEKRYFASASFKPIFLEPDSDVYLSQLKLVTENASQSDDSWILEPPPFDSMPIPHRRVESSVLQKVIRAIKNKHEIEVKYQSMNEKNPNPIARWIAPHALCSDGLRWHVRAFCHIDNKFKDFLLSRILDVRKNRSATVDASEDYQWNEYFEVILVPNPAFSEAQQKMIAQDYGMKKGKITIPLRRSILYYFKKRLRLDVAEALDEPREAPVVIENRTEFEAALKQK